MPIVQTWSTEDGSRRDTLRGHEGEITALDTHVEPRSLFEAQLRNRRQAQGTAAGGAPRL